MKEMKGNMLNISCDALCITTNGYVKKDGNLVMGRGIAKQIQRYFPNITKDLGHLVKTKGNNVHLVYQETEDMPSIISFPVKPVAKICESHDDYVSHMKFNIGDTIQGWACKASMFMIEKSAHQLVRLADEHGWEVILLPRAGCGAGELDWADVKPILDKILDDRFIAVTY